MVFYEACRYLNKAVRDVASCIDKNTANDIQEIRLRSSLPLMITTSKGNFFVTPKGHLTKNKNDAFVCDKFDLLETFKALCEYSVHSYQNEINMGFITIPGGHRAGICGYAVCEDRHIINIKNISSINLRIAKSVVGVADEIIKQMTDSGIKNTVIIGPPGSGKTTVLRDCARQISDNFGQTRVSVVDERGEISAFCSGERAFDLGQSTDCLFCYPKEKGIEIAIRSLSPQVVVFDEIGSKSELSAVKDCFFAGVNVITTVHASGVSDFMGRDLCKTLVSCGAFDMFYFLEGYKNPSKISKIYKREDLLYEMDRNTSNYDSSGWILNKFSNKNEK